MRNVSSKPTNKSFIGAQLAAWSSAELDGRALMRHGAQGTNFIVDAFDGVSHFLLQLLIGQIIASGHQLGVSVGTTGVKVGFCCRLPDEAEGGECYQSNPEHPVFTERCEYRRTQYQLGKGEQLVDLGIEPGMHALHEEGIAELELEFVSFHIGSLSAMAALAVLVVELVVEVSAHLLSVLELAVSTY